jgi:hypothetical protein
VEFRSPCSSDFSGPGIGVDDPRYKSFAVVDNRADIDRSASVDFLESRL